MATITAQEVVDQARYLLQDLTTGGVRWLDAEMLIWMNAAQREVALYKPNSSVTNSAVVLVAGTKQSIPAAGVHLIKVTRNMGAGGSTPGNAVRIVDQEVLDAQAPTWHTDTANGVVKHYVFDKRDPTVFYVYPPQPSTPQYIEIVYACVPTALDDLDDTLEVPDIFANALMCYVMFRALSKDATYTKNGVDANVYYQQFLGAVGALDLKQGVIDPNQTIGNPMANLSAAREGDG
tara:strand:+ start:8183 stop:8887 length:705 start_codon:yes stop_codon:yes gene_type:complete